MTEVHGREKWLALMQELNSDVDPQAVRLINDLRMVSHTLYLLGEQSLEAAGLSYARFRLLMSLFTGLEIDGRSELNPSEISERLCLSRNSISALIRELEDDGLIERSLDAGDRRRFNIRLTPAGRARILEHSADHYHIVARCFEALTAAEQEDLGGMLNRVSEGLEAARKNLQHA